MEYLISVIIPIYNGETVIQDSLKSLFKQTIKFKNIEVLLVNHNSTDNTLKIITNFSEEYQNIKVINLNKNTKSPSYPRNVGISKASSKYIMFLDDDDYYMPEMCEVLYKKIKNEKYDFVSCLYSIKSNGHNQQKIEFNALEKYGKQIKVNDIRDYPEILKTTSQHTVMSWNKIFKKSFLINNNIKFPVGCLAEDVYFNIQCYLNGRFALLNNYVGYIHTIDLSSVSHTLTKENLNRLLCGIEKTNTYLEKKHYTSTEIIITHMLGWTMSFLNNDLSYNDQKELLIRAKPLYNNLKWNTKCGNNYSRKIIILGNIFLKIFSSNIYIGILMSKIYKFLKLDNIYKKNYYSNFKDTEK